MATKPSAHVCWLSAAGRGTYGAHLSRCHDDIESRCRDTRDDEHVAGKRPVAVAAGERHQRRSGGRASDEHEQAGFRAVAQQQPGDERHHHWLEAAQYARVRRARQRQTGERELVGDTRLEQSDPAVSPPVSGPSTGGQAHHRKRANRSAELDEQHRTRRRAGVVQCHLGEDEAGRPRGGTAPP